MSKAVWRTGLALCGAFLILFAVFFAVLGSVDASSTGVEAISPTVYDLDETDVVAGDDVAYSPVSIQATHGVSEADVVVDFGNGYVVSRHITFTSEITGVTALRLAGWAVTMTGSGQLAAIEDVGCPVSDPWCHCTFAPGTACIFWGYYHVDEAGQFDPSGVGANTYIVRDGDVEVHAWGDSYSGRAPSALLNARILAAQSALHWLDTQQGADGSYNDVGPTVDAIFAVAAAGEDVSAWKSSQGNSMVDYLRRGVSPQSYTSQYAHYSSGYAGKLAAGLAAADLDPRNFEGLDLVEILEEDYDLATGSFGTTYAGWQAWAMLGWQAAGETVPPTATQYLVGLANADGGWGVPGYDSDPDTTGLVLQTLAAVGEPISSPVVVNALAFLDGNQADSGGFVNDVTNTQSTAWAVQGLLAVGEDPAGADWIALGGQTPISYLLAMQLPDSSFSWADAADVPPDFEPDMVMATTQVIPALLGRPFPYLSRQVVLRRAVGWIREQQQDDGSFNNDTGLTLDAVFAIVAAGKKPEDFVKDENTPLDYLKTQAVTYPNDATKLGKMIAGVVAAGGDPRDCGGEDLVAELLALYNASTGAYGGGSTWNQAWAMLGLTAAGETVPEKAIDYLISIRFDDSKAWGWTYPGASEWCTEADTDSTGLALQALAAAGVDWHDLPIVESFAYLRTRVQSTDGGWGSSETYSTTTTNSTGLALQALAAYQEVPRGLGWAMLEAPMNLNNPMDLALSMQSPTGAFPYQMGGPDNASATYQIVVGIAGRAFPVMWHRLYLPLVLRGA